MTNSPADQSGPTDPDAEQTAAKLRELAGAVALLPTAPPPDGEEVPEGSISLPVIEQDGQRFIPVFTSEESMRAAGGEVETASRLPMAELAANWPSDDIWLAVNPTDEDGVGLPPQIVRMLPELAGVGGGTGAAGTNGQVPDL
jgi:hypothetical protein